MSNWGNRIIGYDAVDPEQLLAHPQNFRIHPKAQQDALSGALTEIGWVAPVIVSHDSGRVIDGHLRVEMAISKGETTVPVAYVKLSEHEEQIALATFDPIGTLAVQDQAMLDDLLGGIHANEQELVQFLASIHSASTLPEIVIDPPAERPSLSDRFIVPPFSVLDARQGYWQDRKRQWLSIGIQSELGRGDQPGEKPTYRQIASSSNGLLGEAEQARSHYKANATPGGSTMPSASLGSDGKTVRGDGRGRKLEDGRDPARIPGQDLMRGEHTVGKKADPRAIKDHEWQATHLKKPQARLTWVAGDRDEDDLDETSRKILAAQPQSGTSIFDPVLCELAYRWFSPPGGHVLDPMAGGSVRGIVASLLGRAYTGIELRPEQVQANRDQGNLAKTDLQPTWIEGDAIDIATLAPGEYDLIFACPPYGDLERYSDDPRDLSTMSYDKFLESYRAIIANAAAMLRNDRFACFVVGDIRDPKGFYRGLIADTVEAFEDAGMKFYNDAVLVTAVGSLPIRVGRQFESGRKLGKTHQNVLVFVKGDPAKAAQACGPVEVASPDFFDEEADLTLVDA